MLNSKRNTNHDLNIEEMQKDKYWDDLECMDNFILQKNRFTNICRLKGNSFISTGTEGDMRATLRRLSGGIGSIHAQYGDVIGVHRLGGFDRLGYDHYGIYESDNCVYEYAASKGDFFGDIKVKRTTLKEFVGDSGNYFVLTFPESYGKPGKISMPVDSIFTGNSTESNPTTDGIKTNICENDSVKCDDVYKLRSPKETIERAQKRLNEKEYNLITNNCEHYAIWCKTGINDSHQVDEMTDIPTHSKVVEQKYAVYKNIKGKLIWDYLLYNEIYFEAKDGYYKTLFWAYSDKKTECEWKKLIRGENKELQIIGE